MMHSIPILERSQPGFTFEQILKIALRREAKIAADLTERLARKGQQTLGFLDFLTVDIVVQADPRSRLKIRER